MARTLLLATAGMAAITLATGATAQSAASQPAPSSGRASRTTTYEAAFFTQYAPRTALDIVQRVPGFSLDLGNSQGANGQDVRGFAGTAGNVVINGARPSTKAETLDTTLSRIPAQQVVRVELGPGDLYGSDYAGKSQVLNVVLSQQSGIDGNVTAAAKLWSTGYVNTAPVAVDDTFVVPIPRSAKVVGFARPATINAIAPELRGPLARQPCHQLRSLCLL